MAGIMVGIMEGIITIRLITTGGVITDTIITLLEKSTPTTDIISRKKAILDDITDMDRNQVARAGARTTILDTTIIVPIEKTTQALTQEVIETGLTGHIVEVITTETKFINKINQIRNPQQGHTIGDLRPSSPVDQEHILAHRQVTVPHEAIIKVHQVVGRPQEVIRHPVAQEHILDRRLPVAVPHEAIIKVHQVVGRTQKVIRHPVAQEHILDHLPVAAPETTVEVRHPLHVHILDPVLAEEDHIEDEKQSSNRL